MTTFLHSWPDSTATDDFLLEQVLSVSEAQRGPWPRVSAARRPPAPPPPAGEVAASRGPLGDSARRRRGRPARSLVGESIGVWKLVERLPKQGAMSTVYRGERADGRYSQAVAVKLFEKRGNSEEALVRFRREGRVLGQLRHPSTVRLLDAGATGEGQPYLVMEWVDGMPLDALLPPPAPDAGGAPPAVPARVRGGAARTPANRDPPRPQARQHPRHGRRAEGLDFGLAKILDPAEFDGLVSRPGHHVGTLLYASPEQLDGSANRHDADRRLLAGRHPLRADHGFPALRDRR